MPSNRNRRVREFGALMITPEALQAMDDAGENPLAIVHRYQSGEPGDVTGADLAVLETFAADEERPVMGYALANGVKLWLIAGGRDGLSLLLRPEER